MEYLLKSVAVSTLSVIVGLLISKQAKEIQILLSLCICIAISVIIVQFVQPIIGFLQKLKELGDLNTDVLAILLKAVGIALLTEISSLFCSDGGSGSIGKMLQILGTVIIVWLSIPIFETVIELIQKLLGEF